MIGNSIGEGKAGRKEMNPMRAWGDKLSCRSKGLLAYAHNIRERLCLHVNNVDSN